MVANGILTAMQVEIEKLTHYLEDRRNALLRELAGVEKALSITPTTKELREMWYKGRIKRD